MEAATKGGKVNVAAVSRAFLWRDPGSDATTAAAYSLGFADVIDGRLQIVPRGIAACVGGRGVGAADIPDADKATIRSRICSVYDRVRSTISDWGECPFGSMTADASGPAVEGVIAVEGEPTGDGRFIAKGALFWDEGPWPLVFDRADMDHSGATIGTINTIERRGNDIWASGNLSDSQDPDTQALVVRATELFAEGAVNVSISVDSGEGPDKPDPDGNEVFTKARIRSVAVVDEGAFSTAKLALVAALRPVKAEWFSNPNFGNGSKHHAEAGDDERLVWQEPETADEVGQYGCPLTITDDGQIYGHAALWYRCHVGYAGTCVRPPREPGSYKGFLTGERIPGIPTGPLVFRTTHAPNHLTAAAAQAHYDHTGASPADLTIGPDAYGIWVSGALRSDATESDIEILRASALSGDWRPVAGKGYRLVGILAVSAPGFRVARALAASGSLVTVGPGCTSCEDEGKTLEDRVALLERMMAEALLAGLDATA